MPELFGYVHTPLPSYASQYEDYVPGSVDLQITAWDDFNMVNIRTMWEEVRRVNDEDARELAELWRRIEVMLESAMHRLEQHALALRDRWTSPAGTEVERLTGGR